jgi:hypothetical protein
LTPKLLKRAIYGWKLLNNSTSQPNSDTINLTTTMKRLLMISYPFPPNATAGAVRSERFARYLPAYGWNVDVVSIKPRKGLFVDQQRLATLPPGVAVHLTPTVDPWLRLRHEAPRNIFLRAGRSGVMRLTSFPDHMLFWVPFAVSAGGRIRRAKKIDAIYTTSPPHSTHLAGLILSQRTGIPWVADFRDPWTLNAYRENGSHESVGFRIERWLETSVLKQARIVLANTDANKRNLAHAFGFLDDQKLIHLPNGWEDFSAGVVYPQPSANGAFRIVHAGTFYPRFKPYGLLHALADWKKGKKPPEVSALTKDKLHVVLLGARDPETRRVIEALGLEGFVTVTPWVAQEDARAAMCRADMLWATLGTSKESATYVPSKLFEYISAKRPIIGFFPQGEAEQLIKRSGTGRVFTSDEPEPVIRFLDDAIRSKSHGTPLIYKPNREYLESLRAQRVSERFAAILDEITS